MFGFKLPRSLEAETLPPWDRCGKLGWFNFRAGLVGSGTISFTSWGVKAKCSLQNGCSDPELIVGKLGGGVGVTAHLSTFSYSWYWGTDDLFNT